MKAKILITSIFLTLSINLYSTSTLNPTDEKTHVEIVSMEKVPIVKCLLNGKEAYFVLDSGSDVTLVHSPNAGKYGFSYKNRSSKSIVGASGGNQPLFEANTVDLVAGTQMLNTRFYATDLSTVVASLSKSTGITVSGILGMDLMRRYGFEIDYSNQQLVLHPQN